MELSRSTALAVDERAAAFIRDHEVPGVAFGVVADGGLVHAGGVGARRIDGSAEVLAPGNDTRSRICSMTKSFVATALLVLRDDGRLSLDDAVEDHVAQLAGRLVPPTGDSPRITIRDLLTMASGLPTDDAWADRLLDLDATGLDEVLAQGFTFSRPPRTGYEYSNLGWVILGRVIANVAGAPAQRFVRDVVLEPLGLSATGWDIPDGVDVMTGYRRVDDRWEEERPLGDGDVAPMGGLWSTVRDIASWMGFFLDAFPPRDDEDEGPLSRASRREMQQAHRAFPSKLDEASGRLDAGGYGYGLVVTHDLRFGHAVHHAGGLPGFGSHMAWLPDLGIGAVALANVTYAPASKLTRDLLENVVDGEGRTSRTTASTWVAAAAETLTSLVARWDDAVADHSFAPNVDLDEPRERRRADAERARAAIGPFVVGEITATTATSGSVRLIGEAAEATIAFTLTPEASPRIQAYVIENSGDAAG